MFVDLFVLCFRRCPWYLKCVVMYTRYSFIVYMRWVAEAELLFLFRIGRSSGGDSFWLSAFSC